VKIGEDVCEKLDIIPQKVVVKRRVRFKYACPKCDEQKGIEDTDSSVVNGERGKSDRFALLAMTVN
jgi:hypothetical protein